MALDKTIIFIAHRLTIAFGAGGRFGSRKIVESGSHTELIEKKAFTTIWSIVGKSMNEQFLESAEVLSETLS